MGVSVGEVAAIVAAGAKKSALAGAWHTDGVCEKFAGEEVLSCARIKPEVGMGAHHPNG
jgi:hypothetical protein